MKKVIPPVIVGIIVVFIGSFVITDFNLYDIYPHIDKFFHVAGGFIVAWFFSQYWITKLGQFSNFERFIILIAMAALVGFVWEVGEFSTSQPPLVNHQLLRHYIYGGNLTDTLGDLMADVFGAAVLGLFARK